MYSALSAVGHAGKRDAIEDARAYLRISSLVSAPGERPHARSEITIGPIVMFARETPEEVVRAPCVERRPP